MARILIGVLPVHLSPVLGNRVSQRLAALDIHLQALIDELVDLGAARTEIERLLTHRLEKGSGA